MAKKHIPLDRLGVYLKEEIEAQSEIEYKSYAFDVLSEVIQRTPVDTGRARANWNISTGIADHSTSGATIQRFEPIDTTGFPVVYIANGLSYISDLEGGKSTQAPNGISAVALAAVRNRRR